MASHGAEYQTYLPETLPGYFYGNSRIRYILPRDAVAFSLWPVVGTTASALGVVSVMMPHEASCVCPPQVSVALATCNGGRYLREQLESIYAQTWHPLEVIVCDDRSTDAVQTCLTDLQNVFPVGLTSKAR